MQKYANLVDLEKCCRTHIYLQNLASIQPRMSLVKFARSPCTDRPGLLPDAKDDSDDGSVSSFGMSDRGDAVSRLSFGNRVRMSGFLANDFNFCEMFECRAVQTCVNLLELISKYVAILFLKTF